MSKIITKLNKLSPTRIIISFYLVAVFISVGLLSLPIALKPGVEWSFIDVLFTAVSAISVTGLGVVSTPETFSTTGVFILMFILQFGGIGIMTLGTFFWLLFGKKIGLKERQLMKTDQNQSSLSGMVNLMRNILLIIVVIELIGGAILGTYFLKYFPTWQEAYLHGIFASVSATTNAGFDITGQSLIPFAHDYFVQFINIVLLTLGAIGFPVLIELKDYLAKSNQNNITFHFSLYTKVTTTTFFSLMLFGTVAILLLEANHYFTDKTWHESFFYAFFQSATTRNGGLATMDVSQFSEPTLLVLCLLMFVGASPSSVGGGVRTTTFAIILLYIYSLARGYKSVKVFKRELHNEDIMKSMAIMFTAMFLCFFAVIVLRISEPFSTMEILFEVCSAFGTTGLSMGITSELSSVGKLIIILLMFIGRIGILSFIFIISKRGPEANYHYPKERLIIG
jgi:potassium uptake TrkH family protein